MASKEWRKILVAFERCLELPEREREPFLDLAFNGDRQSRRKVLKLLGGVGQSPSTQLLDRDVSGAFDDRLSLPPGTLIGNYQVLHCLGAGGSGVVYKVRPIDDESQVFAIKILQSRRNNDEGVRRFQREIGVLGQLDHPGIAKCVEYGFDDGMLYLVMPYIDGHDLEQHLSRHNVTIHRRIEWFQQICHAVAHAHDHLVLHRDLKPANIMIDRNGNPVVMDFGLAKWVSDNPASVNLTTTGRILGTPAFMAPEQTDGQDPTAMTTDVYGLGALLYFLLTSRPPFRGSNLLDVCQAIRTIRPADPQSIDSSIDRELATICLKCLEKSPQNRYASVPALTEDVQRYLDGVPVSARPRSSRQQLLDWGRQNPGMATLSTLLVLVLGIGFLATTFLWQQSAAQKDLLLHMIGQLSQNVQDSDDHPDALAQRSQQLQLITTAFQQMENISALDERSQNSAAVSWFKLGRVQGYLANQEESLSAYSEALARFQTLADRHPQSLQYQFDIFHCLNSLQRHEEALTQAELLVAADGEQNPDYLAALGVELYWQTRNDIESGNFPRAIASARRGLAFSNQHFGPEHGDSPYRRRIAAFKTLLGRLSLVEGDFENAVGSLTASTDLLRKLIKQEPTQEGLRRDLGMNLGLLAAIQFHLGDFTRVDDILVEMESCSDAYLESFADFEHSWQARENACRLRWLYEIENGSQDSAELAADELHDFLVRWSQKFPGRIQPRLYLAWLLAHPAYNEKDLSVGEQLIDEVLDNDTTSIRSYMLPLTLFRLGKIELAESTLNRFTTYHTRIHKVLTHYWEKY